MAFRKLGNMRGMTIDQITAVAGPWSAKSALANGMTLYQWQAISTGGHYHIALLFGPDGRMVKVQHESR